MVIRESPSVGVRGRAWASPLPLFCWCSHLGEGRGWAGTESQKLGATGPAGFLGQPGEGCPPTTTADAWKLAREGSGTLGRLVTSTEAP